MKEAVLTSMLAHDGVRAKASDRVGWGERLRGSPLPAVTLFRVGGAQGVTTDGPDGLDGAAVQADCWASSPAEADDLAAAVKAWAGGVNRVSSAGALQGAFVNSEQDHFEGEAPERIHRTVVFFDVWFPAP
jgi:hypothetical protein